VGNQDEREGLAEGASEAQSDDVEGHGFQDRPSAEQPSAERTDEGDDVEGHMLGDRPSAEQPSAE
jgi:hypothetical protein